MVSPQQQPRSDCSLLRLWDRTAVIKQHCCCCCCVAVIITGVLLLLLEMHDAFARWVLLLLSRAIDASMLHTYIPSAHIRYCYVHRDTNAGVPGGFVLIVGGPRAYYFCCCCNINAVG